MYGYEEYNNLTPEQILQKITQEQIFQFVFGHSINIEDRYKSPFRRDRTPGCWFEWVNGILLFNDFGDKQRHRSCFKAVMDKYNVTLHTAIKIICKHFNLSESDLDYSPIESTDKLNIIKSDKIPAIITYNNRDFNKEDAKFWSQFLITKDNLIEDNVYPVDRFTIDSKGRVKVITPYTVCYSYPFGEKVKLYMPRNNPKFKWITNTSENDIGNIDNLEPTGKQLIITKSYKDHRVLKNLGYKNVVWFQNEACVPNKQICVGLINRFEDIVVFYDNDKQGNLGSEKIVSLFNSVRGSSTRSVHLPIRKYKWKDPAEFINKEGKLELIRVLNKIGLNGNT